MRFLGGGLLLLAWTGPSDDRRFLAAFVAAAMASRGRSRKLRTAAPPLMRPGIGSGGKQSLECRSEWVDHPPSPAIGPLQPVRSPAVVSVKTSSSTISQPWLTAHAQAIVKVRHFPVTDLGSLCQFVQGQRPADPTALVVDDYLQQPPGNQAA